jgi:hypothetical protein
MKAYCGAQGQWVLEGGTIASPDGGFASTIEVGYCKKANVNYGVREAAAPNPNDGGRPFYYQEGVVITTDGGNGTFTPDEPCIEEEEGGSQVVLDMANRGKCLKIDGWSCITEFCPDLPQPPIDEAFSDRAFKPYIEYCPDSACNEAGGDRTAPEWTTEFNPRTTGTYAQITCFSGFVLPEAMQNWILECTNIEGSMVWYQSKASAGAGILNELFPGAMTATMSNDTIVETRTAAALDRSFYGSTADLAGDFEAMAKASAERDSKSGGAVAKALSSASKNNALHFDL